MSDKFKIIQTAPEFAYSNIGSYSSGSFKNSYQFTSKNPITGSTVITSGILGCNAPVQVSGGSGNSWQDNFISSVSPPLWEMNGF